MLKTANGEEALEAIMEEYRLDEIIFGFTKVYQFRRIAINLSFHVHNSQQSILSLGIFQILLKGMHGGNHPFGVVEKARAAGNAGTIVRV